MATKTGIVFWLCFGFLGGILCASFFVESISIVLFSFIPALYIIYAAYGKKVTVGALCVFLCAGMGFFYYQTYVALISSQYEYTHTLVATGVVNDAPILHDTSQIIKVRLEQPARGTITVLARRYPELAYGDRIAVEGVLEKPRTPNDNPSLAFPSLKVITHHQGSWLKEKLLNIRQASEQDFRMLLPHDTAALLAGITLGIQDDFSKELKMQMAASGTTHLVALSGYNIAILGLAISMLLGTWCGRRVKMFLTILIIIIFVMMVGASASVVRAAIMGILALAAHYSGRPYAMHTSIAATATAMTLYKPTLLSFDIGFQLSFVSLLGIVYLLPLLEAWLAHIPSIFGGLKDHFATTLSAQLAVTPLLILYFNSFSFTAVIANVLILALIPLVTFLGFAILLANLVMPFIAILFAWFTHYILAYILAVIRTFASFQTPLNSPKVSITLIMLYYGLLITLVAIFPKKQSSPLP